jgi:hypothetical protein
MAHAEAYKHHPDLRRPSFAAFPASQEAGHPEFLKDCTAMAGCAASLANPASALL